MTLRLLLRAVIVALLAGPAGAADHPVVGTKLIVVDKVAVAGSAKAVFVAQDAAVTKGAGTDPAAIEATLDVAAGSVHGAFLAPQGSGWIANKASVAKYVHKDAPSGGAVKVSVVKPGRLIKVVAKSLGDLPLDVSAPPSGPVYAAFTVTNAGDTHRHCTQFAGCTHKAIGGGSGHKLVCRGGGSGDAGCLAVPPPTTTTSTSTTTVTLQVAWSVDCCQGAGECVPGLGFSLNFYLMTYCSSMLPGSSGVPGGVCSASGTCEIQSIEPPRALCCQVSQISGPSCYDAAVPATSTAAVWTFRNYCVGGLFGTAYYDAVCGPGGTCGPE
jgi:hypothetical protein